MSCGESFIESTLVGISFFFLCGGGSTKERTEKKHPESHLVEKENQWLKDEFPFEMAQSMLVSGSTPWKTNIEPENHPI